MTVNKMKPCEVAAAAALDQMLFSEESWNEADLAASLEDPSRRFWSAMEGDVLVGFCGISQSFEQGDLLTIGVHPDHRRKGIGNALLSVALESFAQSGGKELFLEVRASNEGAKRLYEKFGFLPIGMRRGYYQQPKEDGLVYRLEVLA